MVFLNDSLFAVLLGDWNKLFIQPDWVSTNVFQSEEMEIRIRGVGTDCEVSYACNDVIITPAQDKLVFGVSFNSDDRLQYFADCINRFVQEASSPVKGAFGINCDFYEEDGLVFAEVSDGISDHDTLVKDGYQICATTLSRTLEKGNKVINIDFKMNNTGLNIHFNEHHEEGLNKQLNADDFKAFINECDSILTTLGYSLEREE